MVASCTIATAKQLRMVLLSVSVAAHLDGMIHTNAPQMSDAPLPWQAIRQSFAHGRRLSLNTSQQQAIVDKHNTLRAGVRTPCTAADMETLVWDTALATASANYASKCIWAHDPNNGAQGWGENLAMSYSSLGNQISTSGLTGFVQAWYDEVEDTQWTADGTGAISKIYPNPQAQCKSYNNATGKCMIGHYTQVVWAKSNKVGCGAVVCGSGLLGDGGVFLVCKYTPAGNMAMSSGAISAPWIVGAPCASCAGTCSNGYLCNVGSNPTRCKDTITTMTFNGVPYTTCASLINGTEKFGTNYWCTNKEPSYTICQLTCGACTVPSNVGLSFCATSTKSVTTNPMTSTAGAGTTASSQASTAGAVVTTTTSVEVRVDSCSIANQMANSSDVRVACTKSLADSLRCCSMNHVRADLATKNCKRRLHDLRMLSTSPAFESKFTITPPSGTILGNMPTAASYKTRLSTALTNTQFAGTNLDVQEFSEMVVTVSMAHHRRVPALFLCWGVMTLL
mmetsp:Transcript_51618/g.99762  ORF Transcript_51618/g.99762 Transcript_51618/m.99762 type:complete len:508 (+) Transcript_51618:74-1597(+)